MNGWIENALERYHNFLTENGLPIEENPEVEKVVYALGYFVSMMDQESTNRWRLFMSQFAKFWMPEECTARPAVTIANFSLPAEDIPFWNNRRPEEHLVDIPEFAPFQNRFDEDIASNGSKRYVLYPLLTLQSVEFTSPQECVWELVYHDENIPEKFPNIPVFIHSHQNPARAYQIVGFLKNAKLSVDLPQKTESCKPVFPLYSFTYPMDDVPIAYSYSWNYLNPYPAVLDFFLELQDLQKKHFVWMKENQEWRAQLVWRGEVPLVNFKEVHVENIKLHTIPLFHWIRKTLQTVQHRQRLRFDVDPKRVIWIKVGSNSEMYPMPYYLQHSLDKRSIGYIKWNNGFIELEVTPNLEEGDVVNPIHIEAILIHEDELASDYKGLKIFSLAYLEPKLAASPFTNPQNVIADHNHFARQWRIALTQCSLQIIRQMVQEYLAMFGVQVENENIETTEVYMRYVPGKGMFPALPIIIHLSQATEEICVKLTRLYEYLKERAPLDILPYFEIRDKHKTISIFETDSL